MQRYTALIIDLEKSRAYSIEKRIAIQQYFIKAINCLNDVFSKALAKDVEFSAGDEVQGLFRFPESAYLYLRLLSMMIFPIKLRAGIGLGDWDVKIENASTTAQDGTVYHNARYAINNAKNAPGYPVLFCSGQEMDLYINSIINTSFVLTNNLSKYQSELMLLLELLFPIDYHETLDYEKVKLVLDFVIDYKKMLESVKSSIKSADKRINPFEKIRYSVPYDNFVPVPTDVEYDSSTLFVLGGKKRGMSTQLSEILNISRQSVEKTIKAANIYEIRNLNIAVLKFMDRFLR
ncbi:MAG: hypothetical protein GX022_01820 [Clostridiaceae bacterium]|nr:hypothetical protein [Clostridiaceae bacterium]